MTTPTVEEIVEKVFKTHPIKHTSLPDLGTEVDVYLNKKQLARVLTTYAEAVREEERDRVREWSNGYEMWIKEHGRYSALEAMFELRRSLSENK